MEYDVEKLVDALELIARGAGHPMNVARRALGREPLSAAGMVEAWSFSTQQPELAFSLEDGPTTKQVREWQREMDKLGGQKPTWDMEWWERNVKAAAKAGWFVLDGPYKNAAEWAEALPPRVIRWLSELITQVYAEAVEIPNG